MAKTYLLLALPPQWIFFLLVFLFSVLFTYAMAYRLYQKTKRDITEREKQLWDDFWMFLDLITDGGKDVHGVLYAAWDFGYLQQDHQRPFDRSYHIFRFIPIVDSYPAYHVFYDSRTHTIQVDTEKQTMEIFEKSARKFYGEKP